ncbi:hypothetical protein GMOD_00003058 [Pyrenophora seminiperda CCB06]|uniref:Uncharacterized protein n=1 Tax=Pyrenophora seminiperda CCB06 TaxID=1302712 RepID=A0A3M7M411_9PLEO|nr:hypothetical protein GMOD_00003058 [Pyrenophora seminiperda CCB06]
MVLEDVENIVPEDFSSPPTARGDGKRFDASTLPHPLPIIGPLIGFSDRAVRFKTESTLKFAERKIGRQLNLEEAQALAFHIYQLEQTKSYFAAAGGAAGTWQWYRTWDKMKYPFYQPKVEDIDKNKFGPITGPRAQFARHAWRLGLYALVAGQMGSIISQLIAQPIAARNTSTDPKLEQFGKELKASSHADAKMNEQMGHEIGNRRRQFEEQVKNRSGGGPSPQASWGKQPKAQSDDDMSPTASNETWGSDSVESWETFSEEKPQIQQRPPPSQARNRQARPQRQAESSSSLPFDDDSPTGGLFQDEFNNPQPQPQAQTGSSWDRLRRGNAPVPLQSPPPYPHQPRAIPERNGQRDESTLGDSFSSVQSDEERSMERERAQREFDARIEKERQGRDFGSDEGKKW